MDFKLDNTEQACSFLANIKADMYKEVALFKHDYNVLGHLTRFIGPITFFSSKVIDAAIVVSSTAESIIKGLANILVKQEFELGLKQLFIEAPVRLAAGTLSVLITSIFASVIEPLAMLFVPKLYSETSYGANFARAKLAEGLSREEILQAIDPRFK